MRDQKVENNRTTNSFQGLFYPKRVAVIGATEREGAIGKAITENLKKDFKGEVIPVNPKREKVLGLGCFKDISSVPGKVDQAIIVVPPKIVLDAIQESAEKGIKNIVVITAGFGEAGSEGASREKRLQKLAKNHDLNLVGPNSLGVMSTSLDLNATFGPDKALPGSISFMSQSGALITAVLDWANDHGIGFNNIVSLGNKAVLDETDFLKVWGENEETDVIIAYLEGIRKGQEFMPVARKVTKSKPIVMIKSGKTEAGARAVSSHTGTLAGSEAAYQAALKQTGVLRVENVQKLFDFAEVLKGQPLPEDKNTAIVTNAGGPGVMGTDALGDSSLALSSFREETLEKLKEYLPEEANIYNPVDILGDANLGRFKETIDIVMEDPGVSAIIAISFPSAVLDYKELAKTISKVQKKHEKPVVCCLMGGKRTLEAEETLREVGIPNYFDPERAVKSLDALNQYRKLKDKKYQEPAKFDVDSPRAREILAQTRARQDNRLGVEAMGLLESYGLNTPRSEIVGDPEQAVQVAGEIGEKVAMKIVSPDILHKSDIGGVKVGIPVDQVHEAYEDLIVRARNYQPDATLLGVQIQEMVDLDNGVETILGMNRDPQFGPVIMFGLGGIFVEILEDTSLRVAPVSKTESKKMVNEIKSAPLLRGARGQDPVDIDQIVESIQRLSQLVTDLPAILELDINPLFATADGVKAVDLRLTVDEEQLKI